MTTDDELRAELAICEAATEGPFRAFPREFMDRNDVCVAVCCGKDVIAKASAWDEENAKPIGADAIFFAHARTGYPAALKELLSLRAKVRDYLSAMEAPTEAYADQIETAWERIERRLETSSELRRVVGEGT